MLIVDKNTDYYDHYSHIYGVDKQIVFDRRGSTLLTSDVLLTARYNTYLELQQFFLLEVGYKQHLIEVSNIKTKQSKQLGFGYPTVEKYDVKLLKTFDEQKHLFEKELSLLRIQDIRPFSFYYKKKNINNFIEGIRLPDIRIYDKTLTSLPILRDTFITKIIDAESIWKDLNVFISSQKNDKNIDIVNSDKDKIVNHGFDTVTSFRNPIK